MKRYILVSLFFAISISIFADSQYSNNSLFMMANAEYEKENYVKADSLYQQILNNGEESAVLYFNLGNAKYKQNEIGKAILNYERALQLDPKNEDIHFNLEMANFQIVDKLDVVEKFFLTQWNDSFRNTLSSDDWAKISVFSFIIAIILCGIYIFVRIQWLRKTAFFSGILLVLICFISFGYSRKQRENILNHDYAIVMAPSITGKSSPDKESTDLFVIHEGTKVKVKSKLNDWLEIQLEDGHVGWIGTENAEII